MGIGPKAPLPTGVSTANAGPLPQSASHHHKDALNAPDIPQTSDAARKR